MAELHERHRIAAEMLASGASTAEISQACNCDPATVWRWQQRPEFLALVEASRSRFIEQLRAELRRGARAAIGALVEIAGDGSAPPAARVSASSAILDRIGIPRRAEVEASVESTTEIRVDLTGATVEQLVALAGGVDDEGTR